MVYFVYKCLSVLCYELCYKKVPTSLQLKNSNAVLILKTNSRCFCISLVTKINKQLLVLKHSLTCLLGTKTQDSCCEFICHINKSLLFPKDIMHDLNQLCGCFSQWKYVLPQSYFYKNECLYYFLLPPTNNQGRYITVIYIQYPT